MTVVGLRLRPWMTFINRAMNIYISESWVLSDKRGSTYLFLYLNNTQNSTGRLIFRAINTGHNEFLYEELRSDCHGEHDALSKIAIKNMQKVFGLNKEPAQRVVSEYPALKSVSLESIQNNITYLKNKGFSMQTLKKNPWLLTYKIGTLTSKLDILSRMNLGDLNTAVPLLQLPLSHLKDNLKTEEKESDVIPQGNRITYTCEKLQCDVAEVCKVFAQYDFLYSIPFHKYSHIMDKLLDAGISPSHILRDVWVFRYGIKKIEFRLRILKETGVIPVKPWMLRSSPQAFEKTLQRVVLRKEVLGESSVVEYLTHRLECDVKTVEFLASKHPILLKKHVSKLKEVFDFLYKEGFTTQHVIQVPRILFHSVETIKSRLTELRKAGSNPASLMTLCKTKREFKKIVEIALKRKLRDGR